MDYVKYATLLGIAVILLPLFGCVRETNPSGGSDKIFVSTDSRNYEMSDSINVTVENLGTSIWYEWGQNFEPFYFEVYENGEWKRSENLGLCPLGVLGPPRELKNGESISFTYSISFCNAPTLPGTYRAVFYYYLQDPSLIASYDPSDLQKAYSQEFEIAGGPEPEYFFISTDSRAYELGDTLEVTVKNLGPGVFYDDSCFTPFVFEVYDARSWKEAEVIKCMVDCSFEKNKELPTGASATFQYTVGESCFTPEKPGTYRLAFTYYADESGQKTRAYSHQFEIVLPSGSFDCYDDSDCVPATCCHPSECVLKREAPICSGIACTLSCETLLDCGEGRCICLEGACEAVRMGIYD
ncbi:MAG: hypothetical protein NT157_03020 [Candidatus Micrarchaeota archaeon]|nr:hypothetical protein [Candidatus Micrarchaeota archaeon]